MSKSVLISIWKIVLFAISSIYVNNLNRNIQKCPLIYFALKNFTPNTWFTCEGINPNRSKTA